MVVDLGNLDEGWIFNGYKKKTIKIPSTKESSFSIELIQP